MFAARRASGDRSAGPIGIDVQGHAGVAIKNGIIRGCDHGISSGGAKLKIANVEVRDSLSDGALLAGAGIAISKSAFIANKAIGNGGYGVAVDVAAGTLAKNVATANALSGITTPFGAIDGGGNKARDNAGEPQCGPPIFCS